MRAWLERVWYGRAAGALLLLPLAWLYGALVALRRLAYRRGLLTVQQLPRPVLVIGNLTVGGSGKTPFAMWLARALAAQGLRVGIVSRGYGGSARGPLRVVAESDPAQAGDEPVLLARHSGATVVVARDRVAAARLLVPEVDVILADDGLQHYRLHRDVEIVVVDGVRRYGNGRLLPAGPLREPRRRAAEAQLVVVNGGTAGPGEIAMRLEPGAVVSFAGGERRPLAAFTGRRVHAVAGIGDPGRFFATLRAAGVEPVEHPFPDHATLTAADIGFDDDLPVLMTEKDAVKCTGFATARHAWLEVEAAFSAEDGAHIVELVLDSLWRRPRH